MSYSDKIRLAMEEKKEVQDFNYSHNALKELEKKLKVLKSEWDDSPTATAQSWEAFRNAGRILTNTYTAPKIKLPDIKPPELEFTLSPTLPEIDIAKHFEEWRTWTNAWTNPCNNGFMNIIK